MKQLKGWQFAVLAAVLIPPAITALVGYTALLGHVLWKTLVWITQ